MNATEPCREEAKRWLTKADEDRRSALTLLSADPPLLDPAAYHCQQAAEKMLKALLAGAGAPIPKAHDLQLLAALALPLFPSLASQVGGVAELTPWGTATRYPDLDSDLGIMAEDVREALAALGTLWGAVAAALP